MVHTKNTARRQHLGLPKARFSAVPTGRSERDLHYKAQLQLPSEDTDWTTLMPTLTGTESPKVGRVINRINEEHANPPTPNHRRGLWPGTRLTNTSTNLPSQRPRGLWAASSYHIVNSHLAYGDSSRILARRATATPARGVPHPPTIATKYPRKYYCTNEEARWKPKRPKALSALREIQKLQEEVEPILPWQPFVRLIHELLFTRGPYRIQCQAIQALRAAAEAYIMEVLGGGNLACMHRNRCTLAPKDIRLFCWLWGDVDLMGETQESEKARWANWRRYKNGRLTPGEAMVLDTIRHRKLRSLIQRRRQKFWKNLKC